MLRRVKAAFEIRKLSLVIDDHFEQYQKDIAMQWVIVNGRKYTIYDDQTSSTDWSVATKKLVSLLNNELLLQNSNEQFYYVSGGNDREIIMLTLAQYDFLIKSDITDDWKPHVR